MKNTNQRKCRFTFEWEIGFKIVFFLLLFSIRKTKTPRNGLGIVRPCTILLSLETIMFHKHVNTEFHSLRYCQSVESLKVPTQNKIVSCCRTIL